MDDEVQHSNFPGIEPVPIARWIPAVVVTGAMIGFVALAWYAYHAGTQSLKEDDLLVVEADKTPIKEKPADPGGMQFPNQDKTIFDTFGSNQQPAKVERVLPAPETPMPQMADNENNDSNAPQSWINDKLHPASGKPEQMIGGGSDAAPAASPVAPVISAPVDNVATQNAALTPTESYIASKTAVVAAPKVEEKAAVPAPSSPSPSSFALSEVSRPIARYPLVGPKDDSHVAESAKIQLGAYRSEDEAKESWTKIQKKFSELADKTPIIVRADLGNKGVYYRLRASGFADAAEAKSSCASLVAKNQPCLIPTDK